MTKIEDVSCSVDVPKSTEYVWNEIGKFDALPWHPAIKSGTVSTTPEGKTVRTLTAQNGSVFREQLRFIDKGILEYKIIGGLPVRAIGQLAAQDNEAGGCRITWSAMLDVDGLSAADAQQLIAGMTAFYQAGVDALKAKFS